MFFKAVESAPNFPQKEQEILKWWYRNKVVDKYLHKNDSSRKRFSFLDGPITANNPMGVHHAHGRTLKDFFQRYKNMQGFKQRFQNGFDSQGLWVEVEVERELGFNNKREIEEFGLENFSKACRVRVEKYSQIQIEQSKRLGMFMDWGNDYYTLSDRNNEHIWYFLKKCHEQGLIYKGQDVMPWCIRCGTAISQHELSDGGYKTLTHDTVFAKFPIHDLNKIGAEAYFLVWTTTPWTLPANTALAVNPDATYVVVGEKEEILILAEDCLAKLFSSKNPKILKKIKGKELVGTKYKPLYNLTKDPDKKSYQVVTADFVGVDEGTGIVHIAPGAGKEDYELGQKENLEVIAPLDEFGTYLKDLGDFSGKKVTEVNRLVPQNLEEKGLLFRKEPITHSYPVCWRCKKELVFRLTDEWFIAMDPLRTSLKRAVTTANFMPAFAGKRMQDWLDLMGDWPISRRRYWGLALPFWECTKCDHFMVVGRVQEMRQKAVNPQKVDNLPELHRPFIDEIKLKCEKCGGEAIRVKAVGDAWLDAGIVPYSTLNYLTNREYWQKWFPFELVSEYLPQIRLWFYSTLVMSVVLDKKAPWKNLLVGGYVVDEKDKPMHKSTGNAIEFNEAADKMGADVMRWLYLREKKANYYGAGNLRFGYNVLEQVRRRFFLILWNTYKFFVTYANLDAWEPPKKSKLQTNKQMASTQKPVLDQWIISKLDGLVKTVTQSLDDYNSPTAVAAIESFVVDDFSTWYIRRSRNRVGPTANDKSKADFYQTAYQVLLTLSKLLAPFTPFLAESLWQGLVQDNVESVHLTDWPQFDKERINLELEAQIDLVRKIVEKGHAARKELNVRVRQPLQQMKIKLADIGTLKNQTKIINLIKDELNVKEIKLVKSKLSEVVVELDIKLTKDLVLEGIAREIVREVQSLRARAGFSYGETIELYWQSEAVDTQQVMNTFGDYIEQKTLSKMFQTPKEDLSTKTLTDKRLEISGNDIWLGVSPQK